ncbi:MAG TPA: AAA family ATPase, partial [Anaeromyxobacteraceae bacterium]|nr:AAA family ATPase [Anaeromyxobacteraceae bacterium]
MYLEYFGLSRKPFSKTPDPAFLYPSRQHAEALARLSHAVEEREIAVLTGEVGVGKTTLTRALVDAFAERCRFALVVNPALPPAQLLSAVAAGFGISPGRRKSETYAALGEALEALDGQDLFPVVIVD